MTPTFTVIVPTMGRPTLGRTLQSLAPQLERDDELLVLRRQAPWGNAARNEAISRATRTHLWFMDDDDMAADGALTAIRAGVAEKPDRVHVFRMRYRDGRTIWTEPTVRVGNVSTVMLVVPNERGRVAEWGTRYEADHDFLAQTLTLRREQPVWHEDVVALVRP